jgi:hypothetical protein
MTQNKKPDHLDQAYQQYCFKSGSLQDYPGYNAEGSD